MEQSNILPKYKRHLKLDDQWNDECNNNIIRFCSKNRRELDIVWNKFHGLPKNVK